MENYLIIKDGDEEIEIYLEVSEDNRKYMHIHFNDYDGFNEDVIVFLTDELIDKIIRFTNN